jgi:hypothetical protein
MHLSSYYQLVVVYLQLNEKKAKAEGIKKSKGSQHPRWDSNPQSHIINFFSFFKKLKKKHFSSPQMVVFVMYGGTMLGAADPSCCTGRMPFQHPERPEPPVFPVCGSDGEC